jgi:hypothetical protein
MGPERVLGLLHSKRAGRHKAGELYPQGDAHFPWTSPRAAGEGARRLSAATQSKIRGG